MNVYSVRLAKPVRTAGGEGSPHFNGSPTVHVYAVASSFTEAEAAVREKYPDADVKGIDLMNYSGVPIVVGK